MYAELIGLEGTMSRRWIAVAALLSSLGAVPVVAQMSHGGGHGHMHGANGAGHDMVTMPGLRGENASAEESAELEVMFRNFQTLSREVEILPNGIRTVTRSSDPAVMEALVNHSVGMIDRVGRKDDPKIFIQSPTLDIFFLRGDAIMSQIDVTADGLVVTQTSDDPELVAALHTHVAEVTDMVNRGMGAVHERMMGGAGN
jgi:hypothetical protein